MELVKDLIKLFLLMIVLICALVGGEAIIRYFFQFEQHVTVNHIYLHDFEEGMEEAEEEGG